MVDQSDKRFEAADCKNYFYRSCTASEVSLYLQHQLKAGANAISYGYLSGQGGAKIAYRKGASSIFLAQCVSELLFGGFERKLKRKSAHTAACTISLPQSSLIEKWRSKLHEQ